MKTTTIEFDIGGIAFRIHTAEDNELQPATPEPRPKAKAKKKRKKRRTAAELEAAGVPSRAKRSTLSKVAEKVSGGFKIGG